MPSEREKQSQPLSFTDYNIAGNVFRAYFDAHHNLVFIIDYTISDRKPNVMLVINASSDGRKWDDVLENDYGIDLENVRPKKDNKYQKLDIEYSGLHIYVDLISMFESGEDTATAITALNEFRIVSSRRAASERLTAADITAENARETIIKTNETLAELATRVKTLRAKLSRQRKEVGREPTKQSAAKILRTEAQIDATNEKTRRAKKRLASAQRRLVAAEEDAEIARGILNMDSTLPAAPTAPALSGPDAFPNRPDTAIVTTHAALPAEIAPQFTEIVPFDQDAEITDTEMNTETKKAEIMADEEVKPLFDKDPEILDEEIAFKPIEFNVPDVVSAQTVARPVEEYSDGGVVSPLSFVPPTASQTPVTDDAPINVMPVMENSAPVLDTITSVEMPDAAETIITETPANAPAAATDNVMVAQAPGPMPEIAPAPISSDFRPVSPITGGTVPTAPARQKPTVMYYIMLVLLIALSIFTLWIYQKSAGDNVPDLTTTSSSADNNVKPQPVVETAAPKIDEQASDSPFVDVMADVVEKVEVTQNVPAAAVEPDVFVTVTPEQAPIPEPTTLPEPEPVPVTPDVEPVPVESEFVDVETDVAVMPEPESVPVETPFLTEPVPTPEPIVNKPAYNVSQQENMFVASPNYESDAEEYAQPETLEYDGGAATCSDGRAPDAFGCCTGEHFTDMGDGTSACCNDSECFPPMF